MVYLKVMSNQSSPMSGSSIVWISVSCYLKQFRLSRRLTIASASFLENYGARELRKKHLNPSQSLKGEATRAQKRSFTQGI